MSQTKIDPADRTAVFDAAQHPTKPHLFQCNGCRKYFVRNALQIDHIIPEVESFPEQRSDRKNFQLLCAPKGSTWINSCHKKKTRKEAQARARRNKVPYRWTPVFVFGSGAVISTRFTWLEIFRQEHVAAIEWLQWSGITTGAVFSTYLVQKLWRRRRPRRAKMAAPVSLPEPGQPALDISRIIEGAREVMGAKGDIRLTDTDADRAFTLNYASTGFPDHVDDKRFDLLNKISAKTGDRWVVEWETQNDKVHFMKRPPLPKIIHHPGIPDNTPWHVLPVGEGAAFDLLVTPHILIAGETMAGKTAMMRAMIIAAIKAAERGEVELILVDPKRIEMLGFKTWPGVRRIVTDPVDLWDVAFEIKREMERRYTLLETRGIPLSSHKKWIVIWDEFEAYFNSCFDLWTSGEKDADGNPYKKTGEKVPGAIRAVGSIMALARRCGIHNVLSTQSPDASMFGKSGVRQNLPGRATVGAIDGVRASMLFGDSSVGRDVPTNAKGRATIQIGDGKPFEVQTFWVPDPADADPNTKNTREDWGTLLRLGMPVHQVPDDFKDLVMV
jgi:hypothetical protein